MRNGASLTLTIPSGKSQTRVLFKLYDGTRGVAVRLSLCLTLSQFFVLLLKTRRKQLRRSTAQWREGARVKTWNLLPWTMTKKTTSKQLASLDRSVQQCFYLERSTSATNLRCQPPSRSDEHESQKAIASSTSMTEKMCGSKTPNKRKPATRKTWTQHKHSRESSIYFNLTISNTSGNSSTEELASWSSEQRWGGDWPAVGILQ